MNENNNNFKCNVNNYKLTNNKSHSDNSLNNEITSYTVDNKSELKKRFFSNINSEFSLYNNIPCFKDRFKYKFEKELSNITCCRCYSVNPSFLCKTCEGNSYFCEECNNRVHKSNLILEFNKHNVEKLQNKNNENLLDCKNVNDNTKYTTIKNIYIEEGNNSLNFLNKNCNTNENMNANNTVEKVDTNDNNLNNADNISNKAYNSNSIKEILKIRRNQEFKNNYKNTLHSKTKEDNINTTDNYYIDISGILNKQNSQISKIHSTLKENISNINKDILQAIENIQKDLNCLFIDGNSSWKIIENSVDSKLNKLSSNNLEIIVNSYKEQILMLESENEELKQTNLNTLGCNKKLKETIKELELKIDLLNKDICKNNELIKTEHNKRINLIFEEINNEKKLWKDKIRELELIKDNEIKKLEIKLEETNFNLKELKKLNSEYIPSSEIMKLKNENIILNNDNKQCKIFLIG